MKTLLTRTAALVGATLLAGSLAACSEAEVESPYHEEFEIALERATTEFERSVLSDDVITRAEYEEAMQRYFSCIESRGVSVQSHDSGVGFLTFSVTGTPEDPEVSAAVDECMAGTTAVIEPLYVSILQNPDRRNIDDVLAECLVATGVVEAPFTGSDYARESTRPDFFQSLMDDETGVKCVYNPSYHELAD